MYIHTFIYIFMNLHACVHTYRYKHLHIYVYMFLFLLCGSVCRERKVFYRSCVYTCISLYIQWTFEVRGETRSIS